MNIKQYFARNQKQVMAMTTNIHWIFLMRTALSTVSCKNAIQSTIFIRNITNMLHNSWLVGSLFLSKFSEYSHNSIKKWHWEICGIHMAHPISLTFRSVTRALAFSLTLIPWSLFSSMYWKSFNVWMAKIFSLHWSAT